MTRTVVVLPPARVDLLEAHSYIAADSVRGAARFLQAAKATFDKLAEMPTIGHRWYSSRRRLRDVRVWRIRGFERWLIFYRPLPDSIEVLRVLHGSRDLAAVIEQEI